MFFLNLTLPEFLALFSAVSGLVVALYLLDRRRRRQRVATLRFFATAPNISDVHHRRKLRQPWSLLLQIVSLTLLLLAIAELQIGSPDRSSRDHVLILDTSAWMNALAGPAGHGSVRLIDEARRIAARYLKSLPDGDRVMLIRADSIATPATGFEANRAAVLKAIEATQPSAAPLNIDQALAVADQSRRLNASKPGEIVFIGAGRVPSDRSPSAPMPADVRTILIPGGTRNCGLREVGVRRDPASPDTWEIFVAAKNYSESPRSITLSLRFGGAVIGVQRMTIAAGGEENAAFRYGTRAAGWLDARISPNDAFPQDDHATLELPARNPVRVSVVTDQPETLHPVFNAIPGIEASFLPTTSYNSARPARITIFDRFAPAASVKNDSIWIDPPAGRSPIPVIAERENLKLLQWNSDYPLGHGLHTRDVVLAASQVYRAASDDITVAESDAGPVIVARDGVPKIVAFGFDPLASNMKYELATPILFANILRWMAPDLFRRVELTARTAGAVEVPLEAGIDPATVRVVTESGRKLPYTVENGTLRFFAGEPGIVRVLAGDREMIYSLTLPPAGDMVWKPEHVRRGVPKRGVPAPTPRDAWRLLAAVGGAGILAEWLLFGGGRPRRAEVEIPAGKGVWRKAS